MGTSGGETEFAVGTACGVNATIWQAGQAEGGGDSSLTAMGLDILVQSDVPPFTLVPGMAAPLAAP